jgi:nicotinamide phosphoribosyltransferase
MKINKRMNPLFLTDGYKTSHHQMYPNRTTLVYSNFTPRSNKYAPKGCDKIVSFGQQMVMKQIHDTFHNEFFSKPKEEVCGEMKRELSLYLNTDYDVTHFEELHDLGYLPIHVKVIEEGTLVPIKVPVLTIYNTHSRFFWLTNYLETIISNLLWKPMTSATIAHQYRKVLTKWQEKTDAEKSWFIDWQGHDFSMRGMDSVDAVISSGLGHLTSFSGTDSLPTIYGARKYYNETGFVGGSVNATEHSVMCAGGINDEIGTFRRLIETYPTGILSVVSDTWDLWKVCVDYLPKLKRDILSRDGKLVIRPDSGNPVDILCGSAKIIEYDDNVSTLELLKEWAKDELEEMVGDNTAHGECGDSTTYGFFRLNDNIYKISIDIFWNRYDKQYYYIDSSEVISCELITLNPEEKGVIELLWDVFGGTINEQGYKVLDSHIGAIYGDSITIDRADEICKRLEEKGFASTNVVLGIGSFTYQYNTRDTFGFAMKATYVEIDVPEFGELLDQNLNTKIVGREIFKDPITDDGTKKSATGLLHVTKDNENGYMLVDKVSWETEGKGELQTIYKDGKFYNETTLTNIKNKLK